MHCLSSINMSVGENALYTEDSLNARNLRRLYECYHAGQRYRIRHGHMEGGKKVAVVIKATSFIDKLISFFPSACTLRRRFRSSLLRSAKNDYHTSRWGMNLIRINKSIPFLSHRAWKKAANPSEIYKLPKTSADDSYKSNTTVDKIYNPWKELDDDIDLGTYTADGSKVSNTDLSCGKQIGFHESNEDGVNYIFSNFYKRKGQELCFIDAPSSVFTANCADTIFHTRKFNHATPTESINRRLSISDDDILFQVKRSNNKTNSQNSTRHTHPPFQTTNPMPLHSTTVNTNCSSHHRELKLMLKITRTRAEQDPEFRKHLLNTNDKDLFLLDSNSNDWGCRADPFSPNKYFGNNHFGRILMKTRKDCLDNLIPQREAADVKHDASISSYSSTSHRF